MDLNQYLDPATISSLQNGGYVLMLILMIVEGPIVTLIAAFLASLGVFDIYLVVILGWIGDISGDFLFYSIGRFGWNIFENKTAIKNQKESRFIQKLDHLIRTNLILAILVIKFTPYAPPIGLTYIGKMQVDIEKYLIASIVLSIPIPLLSGLVGYHIGIVNTLMNKYSGTTLILYILGAIGTISFAVGLFIFLRQKSIQILNQEESISGKIERNTKADKPIDV
ncbi:hypothetical protein H7169_00005 [Candidatus Gracilibacteria bacterium]|nr:hypothetical protein [Candidatus Gracilibacteria bacterium]